MHIQFERSGGFMGTTTKSSFELADLPEEDADNLQTIIKQINFSSLPNDILGNKNVPDQFNYKITIQTQEWEHTILTGDASAPDEILSMIKILNELSRSTRNTR